MNRGCFCVLGILFILFFFSIFSQLILAECHRYMVETACRVNAPAEWVKGMGLLIGHLEKAPEECRMKFEKQ